ncbi:hypothetical protein G4G27_01245 [Sphingomonas sp. So64.6b]|uniref:right-handed parallel beta-helix repeat-containing protein n=1 Tax=Sphingomonas sp. So64.6b TaxID=2997354 RepID=UPI001600AAF0|nr:right-handed parallel beta-helix repeat-containing protein [Sphingomonas sp. So64.6b]QNA82787.1 hypothetical protein G4G27_01245 [Sphingomonas sp. So64.6b]
MAGTTAFIINGTNISVVISGFDIEGLGNSVSPGVNGINFLNGASLIVRNTKIRGFRNGYGIDFRPAPMRSCSFTGAADFTLTDSNVAQNTGFGMIINGAATTARVGNTTVTNDGTGITLLGSATVKSYGDNRLDGNTTDGAFSSILPKDRARRYAPYP